MTTTVTVYDMDGTLKGTLPSADGVQWTTELGGDGAITYGSSALAAALLADPDMLEAGRVKVTVDGTDVFLGECQPTSGALVSPREKRGEELQASAPGFRHVFAHGTLYPENASFADALDDRRVFGFMSEQSAYWYDAADWTAAESHGTNASPDATMIAAEADSNVPAEWPDQAAERITSDTTWAHGMVSLFRKTFTLASDTYLRIYYSGDDYVQAYLNSAPIGDPLTQRLDYHRTYYVDVHLRAGDHVLAFEAKNVDDAPLPTHNVNWIICSVYTLTAGGLTHLFRSDTTWLAHKVGAAKPGMSPGAILRTIIDEQQANNVWGISELTTDFDGQTDSAGVAWPVLHELEFAIGASPAECIEQLEEFCDVHVTPAGVVQAFVSQGADLTASVALVEGTAGVGEIALSSYAYRAAPVRGTRLLVRSRQGWSMVADTAAETAHGRRFLTISAAAALSRAEGERVGNAELEVTARPTYQFTAEFVLPAGGAPPFGKGDLITALDRTKTAAPLRCLSLSGAADEQKVVWTAELEEAS